MGIRRLLVLAMSLVAVSASANDLIKGGWQLSSAAQEGSVWEAYSTSYLKISTHLIHRISVIGQHSIDETLHYEVLDEHTLRMRAEGGKSRLAKYELSNGRLQICFESNCENFVRAAVLPQLRNGKHEVPAVGLSMVWTRGGDPSEGQVGRPEEIFPDDFNVLTPKNLTVTFRVSENGLTQEAKISIYLIGQDERKLDSYGASIRFYSVLNGESSPMGAASPVTFLKEGVPMTASVNGVDNETLTLTLSTVHCVSAIQP